MCCIAQSDVGVIKTRLIVHLIAQSIVEKRAKLKIKRKRKRKRKLKLSKALKSGSSQSSNKGKVNS